MARKTVAVLLAACWITPAWALSQAELRAIIEAEYPGAHITEMERETWKGQKIYEIDFRHGGQNLEAIIGLDGKILSVHIDD